MSGRHGWSRGQSAYGNLGLFHVVVTPALSQGHIRACMTVGGGTGVAFRIKYLKKLGKRWNTWHTNRINSVATSKSRATPEIIDDLRPILHSTTS
ncbi:hypothetical protein BDR04DRAFT_844483 [Suillus decipiens]|nr:hypothetical protein BDR04DRAFT_844483 [Suillus decipiens]